MLVLREGKGVKTNCGAQALVVDPDDGTRALLNSLLDREGFSVREAASGDVALREATAERPALVILEVNLPGITGYEVCRLLRREYGDEIPIVFLSGTRVEAFDRVAGLLIGADDYLVKPFDPDELLARVRRLTSRRSRRDFPRARNGGTRGFLGLTTREAQVLELLVDGLNQEEIAVRLVISPKTVGTHIQRVLSKLSVRSRTQAVALAAREGFFRVETEEWPARVASG